jgi:hypothetical protein
VTPAEDLVKLGIYPDRNNPGARVLYRERKSWEDKELLSPLYSFQGTDARREYAIKRYKFTPSPAATAAVTAPPSPSTSDRHVGSQDTTASSPSTAGWGASRNILKNVNVESMDADW